MAKSVAKGSEKSSCARVRAVKALAWLMAALAAVVLFGLVDLGTLLGWSDPRYAWAVPLEASWGALLTFVISGSYVWIALVPDRSWPAVVQLGISGTALAVAGAAGLDGSPVWLAVPVAGSAFMFAWLTRETAGNFPRLWSLNPAHLLLAAAGVMIWAPYAFHALAISRTGSVHDDTWGINHWPVQGATGLTLGACALAMACWVPARVLLRLTVAMSAAWIGAADLAYPDRAGAMDGPLWGICVVLWGTAVALPLPAERLKRSRVPGRRPRR